MMIGLGVLVLVIIIVIILAAVYKQDGKDGDN